MPISGVLYLHTHRIECDANEGLKKRDYVPRYVQCARFVRLRIYPLHDSRPRPTCTVALPCRSNVNKACTTSKQRSVAALMKLFSLPTV
jgi:hypothetical protein